MERTNKEVRRRIKIIDSLPTEDSALRIVYLRVAELNKKWSHRVLNENVKSPLIEDDSNDASMTSSVDLPLS